jgi:hypothetical protein
VGGVGIAIVYFPRNSAAVQARPNVELICSLAVPFFVPNQIKNAVKTLVSCNKTVCLHMPESIGFDYKQKVRRTIGSFWQVVLAVPLTTATAEADDRAQGRIGSRSSPIKLKLYAIMYFFVS